MPNADNIKVFIKDDEFNCLTHFLVIFCCGYHIISIIQLYNVHGECPKKFFYFEHFFGEIPFRVDANNNRIKIVFINAFASYHYGFVFGICQTIIQTCVVAVASILYFPLLGIKHRRQQCYYKH